MKQTTRWLQNRTARKNIARAAQYFILDKASQNRRLPCVVRVLRLLERLQELERLRPQIHDLDSRACLEARENPTLDAMEAEGNTLMAKINRRLMRYQWTPAVLRVGWVRLVEGYRRPRRRTENERWENFAVWWLLRQITGDGDTPAPIRRFRRCRRCSHWFYAVTDHQVYCVNNCRQKDHADSPEFRAKRARYMRERYRPQEKEREQKAIKGVE